jgi:hypothetical protein
MHNVRRAALASCVSSLLNEAKASVTGIGRGISSAAYEKHRIKQADRLLSNRHILNETLSIYRAIYKQLASASLRPIILINWSFWIRTKAVFCYEHPSLLRAEGSLYIKKFMI